MDAKEEELQKTVVEIQKLHDVLSSPKYKIPKNWMWHRESVQSLVALSNAVENSINKMPAYLRSKYPHQGHIQKSSDLFKKVSEYLTELKKLREKMEQSHNLSDYTQEEYQKKMEGLIRTLDYDFMELAEQFKFLDKLYKRDQDLAKRKWLLAHGYNQFVNPVLTKVLLENWNIIDRLTIILGEGSMDIDRYYYFWKCLTLFDDIIFQDVSNEEVIILKDKLSGYAKSPEAIYLDPYFQDELKEFYVEWEQKRRNMLEKGIERLRQTTILLATIIKGGTIGEHLGRTVCEECIPQIRKEIKNDEDLRLISLNSEKLFLLNQYAPVCVLAGIFRRRGDSYRKHGKTLLQFMTKTVRRSIQRKIQMHILGQAIEMFMNGFEPCRDDLSMLYLCVDSLELIFKKWQEQYTDREVDYFGVISMIGRFSKNVKDRTDVEVIMRLFEETTDVALLEMLLSDRNFQDVKRKLPVIIGLIHETQYPILFFQSAMKFTGKNICEIAEHKTLLGYISYNINKYGPKIDAYEKNLIAILPYLSNLTDLDYLWQVLEDYDANLLASLFLILELLKPFQIGSFKTFLENGGKDVVATLRDLKSSPQQDVLFFCARVIEKIQPKSVPELIKVFNACFSFMSKEVENNRVKLRHIDKVNKVSDSVFRHFGDYLINLMLQAPKNFMTVLFNVAHLISLNEDVSAELIQLAKFCRSYRLFVSEGTKTKLDSNDVEKTYLFLTTKLSKKPKNLEKIRKNIEKFNTQYEKSAFEYINKVIMDLSIEYFNNVVESKIRDAFEKYCGTPLPEELRNEEDIIDVLQIANKCTPYQNKEPAKRLVQEICLKNTYPFKKYPEAFPYNQKANIEFVGHMESRGLNMKVWIQGFEKEYLATVTDMQRNVEKMIQEHTREIVEHYKEAGIEPKPEEFEAKLTEIKERQELAKDILGHINSIKSLQGKSQFIQNSRKVIVYVEQNPIKILQMGNVVGGSCLASDGSNCWTTITNALDINKRVLYIKDKKGDIMARRLIAMLKNGRIIQLGVYNNYPELDLWHIFEEYTLELAERCNTGTSNTANTNEGGDVKTLLGDRWYAGTPVEAFNSAEHNVPYKKAA